MAEELFIPKLGQTVEEVTIINWLVEDGVKVDFGTPIMDVETDKAVFPLEANASGYLHRGPFKEGDVVKVLTVIAVIGKKDDVFTSSDVTPEAPSTETESHVASEGMPSPSVETESENEEIFVSPRAKKLAFEKNIDLTLVTASGGGGVRIVERDIVNYLSNQPRITPVAQKMATIEGIDLNTVEGTGIRGAITKTDIEQKVKSRTIEPSVPASTADFTTPTNIITNTVAIKGVRRIIFDRMGESVHTTARVTLIAETDATQLVQVREQIKNSVSEEWGFAPAYNDLLALIVTRCLREFPYMNARASSNGEEIQWLADVNIGMAVDTDRGLLVPVIQNAQDKNLREIGSEFRILTDRARAGRSLPNDFGNGTFTITNLGMYEIDTFTPVINLPELAILGIGKIGPKVVPVEGEIKIRQMMTLSLVFDHRLVDGAPAARFLQRVKKYIENPYLLIG